MCVRARAGLLACDGARAYVRLCTYTCACAGVRWRVLVLLSSFVCVFMYMIAGMLACDHL